MALPTVSSVVSSGLAGYPTVYYDRVALDTLQSNLFFYKSLDLKTMPDMSGVALQGFDYTALTANTTAVTEGTPNLAGKSLTQNTYTINLSNFADYVSVSNKVKLTALTNVLEDGAKLLAYQGALSVDTIISTAFDTAANSTALDTIDVANGTYMTASLSRKAVWQLRSFNVKGRDNGLMFGIIHSLSAYDMINDATASGFSDLQKFNTGWSENPALVGIKDALVGNVGGCMWYESNAVPTEPNWQSTSHTAYHAYVVGHQAMIGSSLGKTDLGDKNFTIKVSEFPMGSNAIDPAGLIAAAAIYNFFFGCTIAPTHNSSDKFRRIRVESSIG